MVLYYHTKNNLTSRLNLCQAVLINPLRPASTSKMSMMQLSISRTSSVNSLTRVTVTVITHTMMKSWAINSRKSSSTRKIKRPPRNLPFTRKTTPMSFNMIVL